MSVQLSGTVDGGLPASFGDPGRLEQFAGRLDALADEVQGLGSDACEATTGIAAQASWSGNAAEAYLSYCRTKSAAVASLSGPLHEIAAAVRGYAAVLEAQQHRAHSAVRSVEGITDQTADAHRILMAQSQIAEATDELQRAVYQASGRAEEAKHRLELFNSVLEAIHGALEKVLTPWDLLGHAPFYFSLMKPTEDAATWLETQWRVDPAVRQSVVSALGGFKALEYTTDALGLLNDALILRSSSSDKADKTAAKIQGAAIIGEGLATVGESAITAGILDANTFDWVPGFGEVMACVDIGAGIYLGAKAVLKIPVVHNAVDAVGHASVKFLKSEVRFASGVEHQMVSSARSLFRL
ncbi:MAG TPA: WXG100 family type VII secretion target [Actinocrinis sp.]|nr:WXG100 family type VII secretion target [Actinocrinis sp.]